MVEAEITLADLCIVACSEAFRGNGEVVATGVGPIPRLAAGLAKLTHSPELMMTDGEAALIANDQRTGIQDGYGNLGNVIGGVQVAIFLFGTLGVQIIGQEYRFNTIRPTFTAAPWRMRVLAAKLVVVGLTATEFTIADPNDAGTLDVVGFDAAAPAVMGDFARQ